MLERSPVIVRSTRPLIRSKRYNSYRYSTSIVKCCMCEERERERGNANLRFPNVSSTGDYRAFQAFSERHIKCHHRLRDRIRDDGRRRIRGATRSLNEVDPKTPSVCLPFLVALTKEGDGHPRVPFPIVPPPCLREAGVLQVAASGLLTARNNGVALFAALPLSRNVFRAQYVRSFVRQFCASRVAPGISRTSGPSRGSSQAPCGTSGCLIGVY